MQKEAWNAWLDSARSDVAVVATLTPAKEIRAKIDGEPLLPGAPLSIHYQREDQTP